MAGGEAELPDSRRSSTGRIANRVSWRQGISRRGGEASAADNLSGEPTESIALTVWILTIARFGRSASGRVERETGRAS